MEDPEKKSHREADAAYRKKKRADHSSEDAAADAARDDVNKQRCAADHALLFYATISIILTIVRPPLLQQAPLGRQGRKREAPRNLSCEKPKQKD